MNRSSKSTATKKPLRVLVTTGDSDGIGWEVTVKALKELGPQPGVHFTLMAAPGAHAQGPRLKRIFKLQVVKSLAEAERCPQSPHLITLVESPLNPALWVEQATISCLKKKHDALVTGPLSKTTIIEAGLKDIGHTEILSRLSGTKDLFMGFVGEKFSVVLATGHQPLVEAVQSLSLAKLKKAIHAAERLRAILPPRKRRLPIALVGLNPHAGEKGLIGREEKRFQELHHPDLVGPLVPDAAFLPDNWKRYSVFVSPYHDQGLIPFKLVHGFDQGVHLTLNLPFVRTSVDHGTAKELFGLNKAKPGSMRDALTTAIRLCKETPS